MNRRPDVPGGQPTLQTDITRDPCVERKPPPENLHPPTENFGEPENLGPHPNRPRLRLLPKSCTPTPNAMDERAARDWFARNMDIDTTASTTKGDSSGQIPNINDDRMDVSSTTTTQTTRDQVKPHSYSMVSRTGTMDNAAGASLASQNQNQAEAINTIIEGGSKPKWRLCSYCGVPGHPIGKCPMVPCRRCHTVGHAPKNCPLNPCKYCKTTGQHAIGQCPVVLARAEQQRNIKIAARATTTTTTIKTKNKRTQLQADTSLNERTLTLADDKEEEYVNNEFVSININNGQRGQLANQIVSMHSPICDHPGQQRTGSRTNLPREYCDATAHLANNCPDVAVADKNECERASPLPQRKRRG